MYQKVGGIYTRYKNRGWGIIKGIIILISILRKLAETVIPVRTKEVLVLHAVDKKVVALTEKIAGRC